MTVQSVNLITNRSNLSSDSIASQADFPRKINSEELPKTEVTTTSTLVPEALQQAVDEANKMFSQVRPDIKFVIDEGTKDVVILLVEPVSGDIINRYPTEQAMAISNAIVESQSRLAEQNEAFRNNSNGLLGLFVQQKT